MNQGKILIVEDEIISALDLQGILERAGYETAKIATTGEEAVELAAKEKPDVVLMDIHIEGKMDGIQAAEKISMALGMPIIFMTGYSDENMIKKAQAINPYAILNKPLELGVLKSTIKSAIER
ncbi:MAG: response regulator [Nitrospirae bacterium]|nr:response regulator [Nitrospirota bacterium]